MTERTTVCVWVVSLLLLLVRCGGSKNDQLTDSLVDLDVGRRYSDSLALIKPPIKFDWHYWDSCVREQMNVNGPISGSGIMYNPWARILTSKSYSAIVFIGIDESGSPVLITVDANDSPIDTVFLLGDISANSPEYWTVENAEVRSNGEIQLMDSVGQWEVDANGARVPETKKVTVVLIKYMINESGKIEKIQETLQESDNL